MRVGEIYKIIDAIAPFSSQESWDNSGLIMGDMDSEISQIVVSLDLDSSLVEKAKPNTLFITHHPLIFKGLKQLKTSQFPANLITKMAKKDIGLISAHTNFDIHLLNKYVLNEILGYKEFQANSFILEFRVQKSFEEFAKHIKSRLKISHLRVVKARDFVDTAAFCTGSGADLLGSFEADCFLSGDFKYHTALECYENSISLIDIGHYESEQYFGECIALNLKKNGIFVTIENSINPFEYL